MMAGLWRCPTDNDQGGIDTVIGTKLPQMWPRESGNPPGQARVKGPLAFILHWCLQLGDVSWAHRWRCAAYDRLAPHAVSLRVGRRKADGAPQVTARYTLRAKPARRLPGLLPAYEPDDGARRTMTWRLPPVQTDGSATAVECHVTYTVGAQA